MSQASWHLVVIGIWELGQTELRVNAGAVPVECIRREGALPVPAMITSAPVQQLVEVAK